MARPNRPARAPRDPWRDDNLGRTVSSGFSRPGTALPSGAVWQRIEREVVPRPGALERVQTFVFGRGVYLGAPTASFVASIGILAIGLILGSTSLGIILSGGQGDFRMLDEPVVVTGLSRAEAEIQPLIAPSPIDRTSPAGFSPMNWIHQWRIEQRIRMAAGRFEPRCEAFDPYFCSDERTSDRSMRENGWSQDPAQSDAITPQPAVRF